MTSLANVRMPLSESTDTSLYRLVTAPDDHQAVIIHAAELELRMRLRIQAAGRSATGDAPRAWYSPAAVSHSVSPRPTSGSSAR